ncbi:MAG: hypothetical protein ACHQYR_03655 [Candidatus Gagatemarchaeaceae archaeon]
MVSVRTMSAVGVFMIFLSTGIPWLEVTGDSSAVFSGLDIYGQLGSVYGVCHCPPDNLSLGGEFVLVLLPSVTPPGVLSPGILMFPVAVFAAILAFVKLRLVVVAGVLAAASGSLWAGGLALIGNQVVTRLEAWEIIANKQAGITTTAAPHFSVDPSVGPYVLLAGGIVLLATYVLDRREKLDPSDDWSV